MPALKTMHQLVAKHPSIQATLFLIFEQLVVSELLCIDVAYIGKVALGKLEPRPSPSLKEDDYASDGWPGVANFATAMLEPLESQGRGFTHGHKKVLGAPRSGAGSLKRCSRKIPQSWISLWPLLERLSCAQQAPCSMIRQCYQESSLASSCRQSLSPKCSKSRAGWMEGSSLTAVRAELTLK